MFNPGGDLRHSIRTLTTNPGFSVMTVLMLALGIGACTALFTVVNAVLLRPLPYPDSKAVVQLWELSNKGREMHVPEANFLDWKTQSRSFDGMAVFGGGVQPVAGGTGTVRARVTQVSQGFFDILRVPAMIGTTFRPEDLRAGAAPVLVLSYGLWQRALGGSADLAGKTLTLGGKTYSVAGVMPPGFNFPPGTDAWQPRETSGFPVVPSRSAHNWAVIARLRSGVSPESASAEVNAIARRIHDSYSNVTAVGADAVPLKTQLTESVGVVLPVLLAAVGVLLLIACANASNLILVRVTGRQRELAVRTALGASRLSLARLLLCETLLLTGTGAILGALLSAAGVHGLLRLDPNLPRIEEVHADWQVLAFVVGITIISGIVLGIFPVLRAGRVSINDSLNQSGRSQYKGAASRGIRRMLLVGQLGLTVMLLAGAGLLGRSLLRVLQVDLGFQTESRIAADVLLPREPDGTARRGSAMPMDWNKSFSGSRRFPASSPPAAPISCRSTAAVRMDNSLSKARATAAPTGRFITSPHRDISRR